MYDNQSRDVLTTMYLGYHVARATAAFPQTTNEALFTVAGGRVEVTLLIGEVTTAIQNSDPILSVRSTPTTGTYLALGATVDTSSLEIGGFLRVVGAGNLVKSLAGASLSTTYSSFIVPIGTIRLAAGASKTGNMKWDIFYKPIDEGATVTAA
jgi:hypothetical protein